MFYLFCSIVTVKELLSEEPPINIRSHTFTCYLLSWILLCCCSSSFLVTFLLRCRRQRTACIRTTLNNKDFSRKRRSFHFWNECLNLFLWNNTALKDLSAIQFNLCNATQRTVHTMCSTLQQWGGKTKFKRKNSFREMLEKIMTFFTMIFLL